MATKTYEELLNDGWSPFWIYQHGYGPPNYQVPACHTGEKFPWLVFSAMKKLPEERGNSPCSRDGNGQM